MTWRSQSVGAGLHHVLARLLKLRVEGAERVPASPPLIVVANHARRQVDPLLLALATPRATTFISGRDLRRRPLLRLAERMSEVLYVPGDAGSLSRFRRQCGDALARGSALVVFPEGAAMGDGVGVFRDGAAYLALTAGAWLSPAWIGRCGRHRFTVRFGPPISPRPGPLNRRTVSRLTGEIQAAVTALKAER